MAGRLVAPVTQDVNAEAKAQSAPSMGPPAAHTRDRIGSPLTVLRARAMSYLKLIFFIRIKRPET